MYPIDATIINLAKANHTTGEIMAEYLWRRLGRYCPGEHTVPAKPIWDCAKCISTESVGYREFNERLNGTKADQ